MLSTKQLEYLQNCNHRWNVKIGATGSGKSFIDYLWVIPRRVVKCRGEGAIVLLGNTRGTLSRNILDPMRDYWGQSQVSGIHADSTVDLFGKKVHVLGADNKKHVARIQGMTIEYAYGDEITTWSEEVFQMLKSRLRCDHSHFDGTCNPDNPNHWFKAFLDSPEADIYCQKSTIDDNPNLPEEFVKNLKAEYAGTVYYQRYILGEWAAAEGVIYKSFADAISKNDNCFLAPDDQKYIKIVIGVDFGGNGSKHAFVATGFLPDNKGVTVLMSQRINPETPEALNSAFLLFAESVFSTYRRIDAIYCDSAEQVLIRGMIAALRSSDLAWAASKVYNAAKTEINDRIRLTLMLMGGGRFFYKQQASTLRDALCMALWEQKNPGSGDVRLDDGTTDIDTLDAFEYTIERDTKRLIGR